MDQSTLDDDHFAYCYDKPRKTDVVESDLVKRLLAQRDQMEHVYLLRQVRPHETDGMYYSQKHSDLLKEAADEIKKLRGVINWAINYCYKYEAERDAGHPGTDALIPIWQDLQVAVGR